MGRKLAKAGAEAQRERDGAQHKEGRKQPSGQRPPHHYWCLPLKADSPPPLRLLKAKLATFCGRFLVPASLCQRGPWGPHRVSGLSALILTKTCCKSSHSRLQRSSA